MASDEADNNTVIECKHLSKTYTSVWSSRSESVCALTDVSLSINSGQIVGLIGPNGAGKTTLLNILAGLIFPTHGSVSVCGHPARSVDAHRRLGYMPEFPTFLPRYSARAALRYHGALYGLDRPTIEAKVQDLLNELELNEAANRPAGGYSQGMRQRLALGVALMNNPKVMLLDEPSNGLDPIGIVKLRQLLKQLSCSGTAIFISSHRLGELGKLTSDYIFLHRGQIVPFADKIASGKQALLKIGILSGKESTIRQALPAYTLVDVSDSELLVAVDSDEQIADIVSKLVSTGVRIKSVTMHQEDIEDVFLRLYRKGHNQ